ncbi:MAG: hypothetical protein NT070_10290 [Cyanobacteria bacterium]|nr:hypothetical protein [Cyanobacteriota bacterium]
MGSRRRVRYRTVNHIAYNACWVSFFNPTYAIAIAVLVRSRSLIAKFENAKL